VAALETFLELLGERRGVADVAQPRSPFHGAEKDVQILATTALSFLKVVRFEIWFDQHTWGS
jgi:hypothetical protein